MRAFVLILLAGLMASCGSTSVQPSTPIDATLTIPIGQTVTIDGASLGVRFESVTEDSRCPINAMCITAGQAVVKVSVVSAHTNGSAELRNTPASAKTAAVGDVRLEFTQLEPYPELGQPKADYRLTVRVTR